MAQYPPAQAVASDVHEHFARHLGAAQAEGHGELAAVPDRAAIEAMIDAAFWASVRREEGYAPKISLAFVGAAEVPRPLKFERPLPLLPEALTKLAPAVERPGIHLGVGRIDGELRVWGMTRRIPAYCFVVEVAAPGLLVVKHRRREESGKFVNVAVLEGDRIKLLEERAAQLPDCPTLLTSLLGFELGDPSTRSMSVQAALAVSMRKHGRGGTLLIVPAGTAAWRESIVPPIAYAVAPAFDGLASLIQEAPKESGERRWEEARDRAIDAIAGFTAVDGATILTDRFEVLAFGAKIGRREGAARVERVMLTEPIQGAEKTIAYPGQLGGTRHLSAAQFVQDQRDALALVASQDGRFTIFAWSPCEDVVYAHRAEALLL
jgi:hypothetical protein